MSHVPSAFKSFFSYQLTRDDQDLTTFYTDTLPRQVNYPLVCPETVSFIKFETAISTKMAA